MCSARMHIYICVHLVYLYVKYVCMCLLLYIMSLDVFGNTALLLGARRRLPTSKLRIRPATQEASTTLRGSWQRRIDGRKVSAINPWSKSSPLHAGQDLRLVESDGWYAPSSKQS